MASNKEEKSFIAKCHDVALGNDYIELLDELKSRYNNAQIRSAVKVHSEKLLWNWQLGRDIVQMQAESRWGSGIVEQLSLDLQDAFPNEKGFGVTNLWHMKIWYLFYSSLNDADEKLHQLGKEIHEGKSDGFTFPEIFAFVPCRHHIEIISRCKSIEKAIYYIYRIIEDGLSRAELIRCMKSKLYQSRGGAISNFASQLPTLQANIAQEITKENYDFGFLELPLKYDENILEEALAQQLTRFLLEFGTGFAFIGRQKEIVVAGKSRRIDMLFYHIHVRAYVVCELKAVAFEPEFVGKLNFYVNAVNNLIKREDDNPTIGLLICSDMNKTGISSPIGVAAYDNVQIDDIKKQLPTLEELQNRIRLLEEELKREKHNEQ